MKKMFFVVLSGILMFDAAIAGVSYTQTDQVVVTEQITVVENTYSAPRVHNVVVRRPYMGRVAEPVRVKTHTEIIDHYQVYQPVTVYQPVGAQIQRRVVPVSSCYHCDF